MNTFIRRGSAWCALLSLLLLTACGASSAPAILDNPNPDQSTQELLPPDSTPTAPTPPPPPEKIGPTWDANHSLGFPLQPIPPQQLELSIIGATGYATVSLGVWENRPNELTLYLPDPPATAEAFATAAPKEIGPDYVEPAQESAPAAPLSNGAADTPSATQPTQEPAPTVPDDAAPTQPTQPDTAPPPTSPVAPAAPVAPDPFVGTTTVLPSGTPFQILAEEEHWWQIRWKGGTGWVEHRFCMINLPDVIPSIVYDAINSYRSRYHTSGYALPGITGQSLYAGTVANPRLGRDEFMVPVLYATAKRLCHAQQLALAQGNTIILYEAYRPYTVQKAVRDAIADLGKEIPAVMEGVSAAPWSQTWFISNGYSNHQRGFAVDVGLAKITKAIYAQNADYSYLMVQAWEEYEMPTPVHELSIASAVFTAPVDSLSPSAWLSATLADTMNDPALALQRYFADAGMTPLASEWWHFNDLTAMTEIQNNMGTGNFEIKVCVSTRPSEI